MSFDHKFMYTVETLTCQGEGGTYPHPFCFHCNYCLNESCSSYKKHNQVVDPLTVDNQSTNKGGHPRFHAILKELADLHYRKNTDYAKDSKQGPLGNFTRVAEFMKLYPGMDWDSPLGVCLVYTLKQIDAALMLRSTKRESVTGEPIGSRLKDVATYMVIAMVIEEEERGNKTNL